LKGEYAVPEGREPMIVGFLNSLALGDLNLADEAILSALHDNITLPEETVLVNKISSHYLIWKDWDNVINSYKIRFLDDLFKKYNSPFIENHILFRETQFGGGREYTQKEIAKAREIRSDPNYHSAVISVLNRNKDLLGRYQWKIRSIQSIIDLIRKNNPKSSLTFTDIGIKGSALPSELGGMVSMDLADPVQAIWKKSLRLKDGEIWFNDGHSALLGWAGTYALDGTLLFNGKNIPVEAGSYEVEINLTDLTYSLTKLANARKD
jgi:hypothetical protein